MKTLLAILFLSTVLHTANISYILPQRYDDAVHHLSKQIKKAKSSVTIISTKIDNYTLKKAILSLIKKNISIILSSSSDDDVGTELVQYSNVSLYILDRADAMPLTFSLIIVDDTTTCKLSCALDEQSMRTTLSLLECSNTKYAMKDAKKIIKTAMQYASPYLKEHF